MRGKVHVSHRTESSEVTLTERSFQHIFIHSTGAYWLPFICKQPIGSLTKHVTSLPSWGTQSSKGAENE